MLKKLRNVFVVLLLSALKIYCSSNLLIYVMLVLDVIANVWENRCKCDIDVTIILYVTGNSDVNRIIDVSASAYQNGCK